MGSITDIFDDVFRDFTTDGVLASGANEPEKSAVRGIGRVIEAALGAIGLGTSVDVAKETRAALNADLAFPADSIGLVYADGLDANNDLYVKTGASGAGGWTLTSALHGIISGLAQPYVTAAEAAVEKAVSAASTGHRSGSFNLFDPADVIAGRECYNDGQTYPEANSVASALMPITGARAVAIAGLGLNPGFNRFYNFLADDGVTHISSGSIPDSLNAAFLTPPAGAAFFRFSPKQRYAAGSADFGAVRVFASNADWAGKSVAILGDSISETTDVDSGKYLFQETHAGVTEYRRNWPYYALPRLLPSRVRLYAKSGGHFADAAGLTANQKFSAQVANALADTAPDVIFIGLGTNDWGNSTNVGGAVTLGTAAGALAKDYGSLDPTISMEGMRKGIHLLRYYFPEAVIFGLTPLQRGDFNPRSTYSGMTMNGWVDEIRTMYQAYGVEIIDQFAETGINWVFEQTAPGPHLADKIHPLAAGMILQSDLAEARFRARLGGA